ncbi:Antitoxin PezA [Legionella beliardensis]|uniref:Antitoxin PezA n=2 Tax=Legionella beliardensis TaxID=91822 RepID=A0A378JNV3_9GAMM|nr:Antitoxin PezA [Legionella beliardensis]
MYYVGTHEKPILKLLLWLPGMENIVGVIKKYKVKEGNKNNFSIDDVFGELIDEHGEPGLLLKGLRHREGLSQIKFAKLLNISQTNLSAMENGRRAIGKEFAKRIGEQFNMDYRSFL